MFPRCATVTSSSGYMTSLRLPVSVALCRMVFDKMDSSTLTPGCEEDPSLRQRRTFLLQSDRKKDDFTRMHEDHEARVVIDEQIKEAVASFAFARWQGAKTT